MNYYLIEDVSYLMAFKRVDLLLNCIGIPLKVNGNQLLVSDNKLIVYIILLTS